MLNFILNRLFPGWDAYCRYERRQNSRIGQREYVITREKDGSFNICANLGDGRSCYDGQLTLYEAAVKMSDMEKEQKRIYEEVE